MKTPPTDASTTVENALVSPSEQLTVWLASRATDGEKSWEIQAYSGSARQLQRSSDPLLIPISANGLQRLSNRLANRPGKEKTGKTLLALKVKTTRDIWPDDSRVPRWQVCAPGSPVHNSILQADHRDIADMKLLKKAGLKPSVVFDIHRLTQSARRATPSALESATESTPESATEAHSESKLAHLLYLPKGTAALSADRPGLGSVFPSIRDLLHAILIAGICAIVIPTTHQAPAPQAGTTPPVAASIQQLLDLCRPLDEGHLPPANTPIDSAIQ